VLLSISRQAERDLARLKRGQGKEDESIHSLRVRMKKLRAVLLLVKPHLSELEWTVVRERVRELKRAVASSRDEGVMLALLKDLGLADARLAEALLTKSAPAEPAVLSPSKFARLLPKAQALTRFLENLSLHALTWSELTKSFIRRYRRARRNFAQCQHKPDAAGLHHWRGQVKDHYYQSLLLLKLQGRSGRARKIGSLLGKYHDCVMLRERLDPNLFDDLHKAIRRRMRLLRQRAFREAQRLFSMVPKKLRNRVLATVGG
jgi:CHAD domain-containing protein